MFILKERPILHVESSFALFERVQCHTFATQSNLICLLAHHVPGPLALPDDCNLSGTQRRNAGQSPLPKLPNLAAVQEASHLAELAESELAVTWTGVSLYLSIPDTSM